MLKFYSSMCANDVKSWLCSVFVYILALALYNIEHFLKTCLFCVIYSSTIMLKTSKNISKKVTIYKT